MVPDCETQSYLENDGTCPRRLPQEHVQEEGKTRDSWPVLMSVLVDALGSELQTPLQELLL